MLFRSDLIASGVPVSKAVALFEKLKQGLDEIGTVVVTELTAIGTVQNRTALLQRNRARLGKAAATLLITAIGDALPGDEADRIRIGAIEDRRYRRRSLSLRADDPDETSTSQNRIGLAHGLA